MATQELDTSKVQAFAQQMMGALNGAHVSLMLSVGYHTGLIDTLALMEPSTSTQIAERAGLNERYVREWLGAMVTGRIVSYDPAAETYVLPAEHAALTTRAAGPNNLAVLASFVPQLASVEDGIIRASSRAEACPTPPSHSFSARWRR
jgi:hypothetical protein